MDNSHNIFHEAQVSVSKESENTPALQTIYEVALS